MAKRKYPRTIDKNIILVGPYQYRVQIRKRGYNIATETFESFDEALEHRDRVLGDIRRGEHESTVESKNTTLGDVLQRYADEVVSIVTTKEKYARQLKSRVLKIKGYGIGSVPLADLDVIHLQAFRDARRSEGRSRKTVKEDLAEISRVVKYAQHEWHIRLPRGNPVDVDMLLKHISNDAKIRQPIKDDSVIAALLAGCAEYGDKHSLYNLIDLALKTGMRRGQLVHLLWENVDLLKGVAYVVNKEAKNDNRALVGVPLTPAAIAVFKRMGERGEGKVFFYTSADTVTRAVARVRERSDVILDGVTPHILRHTVVHKLKVAGVSKEIAKLITGHKTDQMHAHYGQLDAEDVAGTIEDF